MKKTLALLVVMTVVANTVGCGCCRRVRDLLCRGAYCGAPAAMVAPAPLVGPAPLAACPSCPAPMAYDPGCGYDGMQTLGYGGGYPVESMGSPVVDSGWSTSCPDCQGGLLGTPSYNLPSYDEQNYGGQSYPVDSGFSGGMDPGPAPTN